VPTLIGGLTSGLGAADCAAIAGRQDHCETTGAICPNCSPSSALPRHLRRKLRTTNTIERCLVEVRRRTRPMVCFVNVQSVDRIVYSIFQRFNLQWKTRTLRAFTQAD